MTCPDEDQILSFTQGALAPEQDAAVRTHLDGCGSCRQLVAMLIKTDTAENARSIGAAGPETGTLRTGTEVGRYLILEPLGAGGMSWVYTAYDPSLDRKVALKFLKSPDAQGARTSRLLLEAKAMARLAHPNVVSVYDAGAWHGAVFLALERVEGQTLRAWLNARPRGWRDIVHAFAQAGEGLRAAHAAGIVHRDFKPDNVLVGEDGRVRVTDFGLARETPSGEAPATGERATPPIESLTQTGALAGTPAYMAPEQLASGAATPATDQFSFCVALYEALFRDRPFTGASAEELLAAFKRGPSAGPATVRHPVWLRRALRKGLSLEPAARHAEMGALLLALKPPRWQARAAALAGAATVLGAIAAGALFVSTAPRRECTAARPEMADAWNATTRDQLIHALAGTGNAAAPGAAADAADRLDAYAAAWSAMHTEACLATKVRGDQSPLALDLRMQCLADRLKDLRALVAVLSHPDAEVALKAARAVRSLTPLSRCADLRALSAPVPLPVDPALRAQIDQLKEQLSKVKALRAAGKFREGLELSLQVTHDAAATGYTPLEAELLYQTGYLQAVTGDDKTANETFRRTIWTADRAHDDLRRAGGWLGLLFSAASQNQAAEARECSEHVRSILARVGGDDAIEESRLNSMAALEYVQGHYAEAAALHQDLLKLSERVHGPKSIEVGNVLYGLGIDLTGGGRHEEAVVRLRESAALLEELEGPTHPEVADPYEGLGTAYGALHRYPEAEEAIGRAIAIGEKTLGPEHPIVATFRSSLGDVYLAEKKYPDAVRAQQRSLDGMEKTLRPDHPDLAYPLSGLGDAYERSGDRARAVPVLERALTLRPAGAEFPADQRATIAFALARALWSTDRTRALALAQEAKAGFAKVPETKAAALEELNAWLAAHRK